MTGSLEGNTVSDQRRCTSSSALKISQVGSSGLLNIKKIDKQSMLITNRLLSGIGGQFTVYNPLRNKEEQWYIRLSSALHKPDSTSQYLCLESNDCQYWIADGIAFLGNLTGIHLQENQAGMLNMLLPKIPQFLQEIFGWQLAYPASLPPDLIFLDLRYGSGDVNLKACLAMPTSTCLQVINHPAFKPIKPRSIPRGLTVKTHISLGSINMGMLEGSKLEVGDLVFLQHSHFDTEGNGCVSLGPFNLFVHIDLINNQYQLAIHKWERKMSEVNTYREDEELINDNMEVAYNEEGEYEEPGQYSDGDGLLVGDLPIKIDVRIGSIQFTVNDLQNIVEGKLYTINSPCEGQVQLIHNNMELARGQLVEVDGKLAIEIQKRWVYL